jgi:tetratricopeptide (TPR) repeat protein
MSVAVVAGSAGSVFGQQETVNEIAPRRRVFDSARAQVSNVGFFESLFGFGGRSGSSEEADRNRAPAARPQPQDGKNYPALLPNASLTSAIQRGTPAKRAAALRLAEKGRQYIAKKQHQNAVNVLEKALGLEANPYVYYYLSRAHYHLGHYGESANFLDVAASLLEPRPEWASELAAVRAQYPSVPPNDGQRQIDRVAVVRPTGAVSRSGM